jgi:hypothetical protein
MTALSMGAAAAILWVMAYPGMAQDPAVLRALYYVSYVLGGPGFSVPFGLLVAGVSATAAFAKLLPKWVVALGLLLAVTGELSGLNLLFPRVLPLIPLTRFPGFVWLIASGFLLPAASTALRQAGAGSERS